MKDKVVDYDTYIETNQYKFKRLRLSMNPERLPRRRPRDPEEDKVLMILAKHRWTMELQSGKIVEVGSRYYRIEG